MKGGHFINDNIAHFDAPFFSITPSEAKTMDPQQRMLLEVTYEAFENGAILFHTCCPTSKPPLLTDVRLSWHPYRRSCRKQDLMLRGRLFFQRLRDQFEQGHREQCNATTVRQHYVNFV